MASCGSEDALRRAPVLCVPNRNSLSRVSKKRDNSISTSNDDIRHRRRRNSPPQREIMRNDSHRNKFSNSVERNMNRSPLPFRRSSVPNHGRSHHRIQDSNFRRNDAHIVNIKQCSRGSGHMNNTRTKSIQNCSSLGPILIDDVEYPSTDASCFSGSDKSKWYFSLSFPQQMLSLFPQSSNTRDRKPVTEMAPGIFIQPEGLVDAKKLPIDKCTEHVWKMIHPQNKKVNDNFDDSDNEEVSIRALLDDGDSMYASRAGPVSPIDHLTKDDVKLFFVALSKNNAFNIGYRNNKDEFMYCPCSS